jgi:hypothetical protein
MARSARAAIEPMATPAISPASSLAEGQTFDSLMTKLGKYESGASVKKGYLDGTTGEDGEDVLASFSLNASIALQVPLVTRGGMKAQLGRGIPSGMAWMATLSEVVSVVAIVSTGGGMFLTRRWRTIRNWR